MSQNSLDSQTDLRVRRTHKLLWEALMSLLAEQSFASISVKDICERAMVHRATFYKHYEDKHDLLMRGMRSMHDELVRSINREAPANDVMVYRFKSIFEHIAQHQHFYKLMFCSDGVDSFQTLMRTYLAQFFAERLRKRYVRHPEPAIPLPLMAQFCAGSLISTTAWWLENDMPYSIDEMAWYVSHLTFEGQAPSRAASPHVSAQQMR